MLIRAVFALFIAFPVIAQPPRLADAYLLQDDRLVAIDSAGQPLNTFELTPLAHVQSVRTDHIDRRIFWNVADIDPTERYLYRIEAWGRSTNRRMPGAPTGAELVRIDLETNAREVMLDNASVFNFVLSPDGERMVVFFYDGEYLNARQQACVLTLDTGECFRITADYVGRLAHWINSLQFLLTTNITYPLGIMNTIDGTLEPITLPSELEFYMGTSIQNTSSLILPGQPRENALEHPIGFFIYDLNTNILTNLPYTTPNTIEYISVGVYVSPNTDYLLYSGHNTSLVDFQTGEMIREFKGPHQFGWLDDHTLLVQRRPERGELEVMRVDARSGSVETVLTGAAAEGMLLFP
jgi:hypothetical protein